ncbi:MAG: helix-turn-helix domain protein [Lachnospiraceae bacterium]|jgi:transcriptional regulator with XRE-family HTH domain|nr:helix-turn-helix domain protein [Anaerocolumna sp.]MDF2609965.1 helix-turn-helix domain protein [Lachnospiraceae bacterium]
MSYEHFGILLRELRESRSLTREQLARNICTPKQIYRIEKGDFEPSLYLLNQLSIKFNLDLNEYFKMHFTSRTIEGYDGIAQINHALQSNDLIKLRKLVKKYEKIEIFKQGENLEHILYGKALCSAILDGDYSLSMNYCVEGLRVECPDFSLDSIPINTYSNVGLTILNCICGNYLAMNQKEEGIKVLYSLLTILEKFILSSPYPMYQASQFSKKIYQVTVFNIAFYLLEDHDLKNALHYVDIGIDFSLKEDSLYLLPGLYEMKLKVFYAAGNYEEARSYYDMVACLYKITKQPVKLQELQDNVRKDYPLLLKQ